MELNASDDRGINVVRNEILTFAKTSIGNPDPNCSSPPFKILILDEADAMTQDAQSALRKIIEETSKITRFCLICNYVDKIIEPIISRCMTFRFLPICQNEMIKRLKLIAKKEHLNLDDRIFQTLTEVVEGDLRRGIMLLQNISYICKIKNNLTQNDVYDLVGKTPMNIVGNIFEKCRIGCLNQIIRVAQDFNTYGFPIETFC